MTKKQQAIEAAIVIDGYMTHAACLGDITAPQFKDANAFSQESLSALLFALVLHERALVGPDVIGDIGGAEGRVPILGRYFSDALVPKDTLPLDPSSPIAIEYGALKKRYQALGRVDRYEDALTDLVEHYAFKTSASDVEANMRRKDHDLYTLLVEHTRLRARMYVQEAYQRGLPYVPNPIRRRLFSEPDFLGSVARDAASAYLSGGPLAERLLNDIVGAPRQEWIDKFVAPVTTVSPLVSLDLPPLMQLILNESRSTSVFETAKQLRGSRETSDFRSLCRDLQVKLTNEGTSPEAIQAVHREVEKAQKALRSRLKLTQAEKEIDVRGSIGLISVGTKMKVKDKELSADRPAYAFLYNVAAAFGRSNRPPY